MAEFKLGRIKFVWKNTWTTATTYYVDDVVKYGGQVYICAVGHVAAASFLTDLNAGTPKWNLMSSGTDWKGNWAVSTAYKLNDVVKYGGNLYIANTAHTSAATNALGLEQDLSKWDLYAEGFDWKDDWATSTRYKINDLVKYGGTTYVCNEGHTSAATATLGLETDQSKWDSFNEGIEYKGTWAATTRYKINDVVKYGAGTWICVAQHTSTSVFGDDILSWNQFNEGFEYESTWSSATIYQPGDIVAYGGNQYVSKTNHSNANPRTSTTNWDLYSQGLAYQGDWTYGTAYKINELVKHGGYSYVASTDAPAITNTVTATNAGTGNFTSDDTSLFVANMAVRFTGTTFGNVFTSGTYYIKTVVNGTTFRISTTPGGATFTPTTASGSMTATVTPLPSNTSYYTELTPGIKWRGVWADDTEYIKGDAVRYGANTYICVLGHRAEGDDGSTVGSVGGGVPNSRPDQDVSGTYWNALTLGSETSVLTTTGDLVYYSNSGPTRLPVGTEGQVLKVGSDGTPEWAYLWQSDHVYYVATHGSDVPYPVGGSTLQNPWASIRYACEQVLNGPLNPRAKRLLEMNRVFIQREVSEWIDYQVTNNIAPFTTSFVYAQDRCERDTGWVVDAIAYDISHGGNVKSRGAALAYVNAITEDSPGTYTRLSVEADEDIAAFNYMLTLVEKVLTNTAPAVNYQTTNGDNSTAVVAQHFETDDAEPGVFAEVTTLVGIITSALTDQDADNIPARYSPNNIISVKTGRYRETLPIIVPEETCILGDEIRSVNAGPAGSLVHKTDATYSIGALGRLETVVGQIVVGTNVTESSGNTASQDISWPLAVATQATTVQQLVRSMQHKIDFKLGTISLATFTDPTGYNSSFLSGYRDARTLLRENKEFLQAEIIAFVTANYPSVKYSKTACRRDVGYIVDAMTYDLTYDGSTQSLNAGLAYYDGPGSTLMIASSEKAATLAAYTRLKTVMQQVIANTVVSTSVGNTATQFRDTSLTGGSSANAFVGANMDIIYNIINASATTGRPYVTATTITGTDTITTSAAHGLAAGDLIVSRTTSNGLTADVRYYVLSSGLTSTAFKVSTSYGGSAATLTNGSGLSILLDTEDRPTVTNAVTTTTALITAYTTLSAAVNTIVTNMTTYISTNYPTLVYNSAKCQRDARIILDAVGYDFMFNSNFQTLKAAYSYLRSSASDVFSLNQKAATRAAFTYVKTQAKSNVGGDATAQARIETLMTLLDDVIYGATNEGNYCVTGEANNHYAVLQLERNRDYIVSEISAYINSTYTTTVTNATAASDLFTCTSTSWMKRNTAIRFTGTTFGGVSTGTTYYVQNVVSSTTFKIATTRNASTPLDIASNATGSMTVSLYYNTALCERDTNSYIDALKYDLRFVGNYKSLMAARLYSNAVTGSQEEDMYYVRNATGIRNQTLEGLNGDLLAANSYGTSRVSAGAYVSLDPGYGPDDFNTWIISRSPYVQNCSTFGYAAIGQKIDGSLHNGGNKSIVSNDFTQVIGDGIGAWVTNNGRAELVSVFTYYSHVGYLAEAGGRIRGTNGNNSYGDFGSVAEGFDATETPNTAVVDNRAFDAAVGSVYTDAGDDIYRFEFDNCGSEYTEATWTVTGSGTGAIVEQDEFRDDAVFQVRLLDNVDDSTDAPEADGNFGGFGYLTSSNTAQAGTTTQITIAATDAELSTAYVGMKIYLTGGTGVGQFGVIATYNSGSKIATVNKESTGTAGWDHVVPGTTIVAPDASTTYTIEPRLTFTAPGFTVSAASLPTSGDWRAVSYGDTTTLASGLTGTYSGAGSGATWNVQRNGTKYTVTLGSAGTGYTRLQTVTIAGTSVGSLSPTNDITITITAVNSVTGAIQAFDYTGYGMGGRFVALRSGSQVGATSEDGITWTTRATLMPSTASWSDMASGLLDDGSSIGKTSIFVAVASGTANTSGAYSFDGITWVASSMVTSAIWVGVAFGEQRFVAINSDTTTVRVSNNGVLWDLTGTLPSTGFTSITYGMGLFVAVKSGSTTAAYSTDGITWNSATLPSSSNWNSVTWGNGRFVAVSNTAGTVAAYSLDGATWTASTLPTSASWTKITYGQGVFLAVSGSTAAATSEDGIVWTARTMSTAASGFSDVAFGNPQRSGIYAAVGGGTGTVGSYVVTGATTKARAFVAEEKIYAVRITEPGSGYASAPTMTITDPNNIYEAPFTVRLGDGALANPSFKNRGTGYASAGAEVDTGDGYGDYFQDGAYVAVKRLTARPVAGSNVVFSSLPNDVFKLVNVLTFLGSYDGSYSCFFQISPNMKKINAPAHLESATTRIRYSQVRLTGHDFLDIGTGNVEETNYPDTPTQPAVQANETVEGNGGRVFFTSTDQDGNFRVGDLFTIEQSTGVATLNADAFNIAGLQELTLGEVSLGGGSASITEFSTDPYFTANSDSIVPTQRAIKAYISSQIGGGGASINVNSVTAGSIYIGTNQITTVLGTSINVNAKMNFIGGITGVPLAFNYFIL